MNTTINPIYAANTAQVTPITITAGGIRPGKPIVQGSQAPQYDASGRIVGYGQNISPSLAATPGSTINPQYQAGGIGLTPAPATPSGGLTLPKANTPSTDPNSEFSLLNQTKNPQLAGLASNTATNVQNVENTTAKTFADYLKEAKDQQSQEQQQISTDAANLAAIPSQTQAELDKINQQYAQQQGNINAQYQAANLADASRVNKNISDLSNLDTGYITNTLAGANLAAGIGEANVNRFNAASGTPNSVGSGYYGAAAQVAANALIPAEQQVSQMQIGQLTNFIAPQQQQLYTNELGQLSFQSQGAQQIAQMQTGSAEQVAALKQATAGRSAQESMAFMQSLGIPLQVAQSVLSGSVSQLGALTSADNANNFYGLSTNYNGTPIASPNYSTPNINPVYSGGNRGGGQPALPAPTAPINPVYAGQPTAQPIGAPGGVNYAAGGTPANPAGYRYGTPAYYAAIQAAQQGYTYDPNLGVYVDRQGQVVNPGGGAPINSQYQPQPTPEQSAWTDPNATFAVS